MARNILAIECSEIEAQRLDDAWSNPEKGVDYTLGRKLHNSGALP